MSMREKKAMPLKTAYHIPFNSIYLSKANANDTYAISDYNNSPNFDDYSRDQTSAVIRQSNYSGHTPNEFEHYSQVMNEPDDNFSTFYETDQRDVNLSRYSHVHELNYPYTVKTNTQYGSIVTSNESARIHSNNDPFKNIYRAVEYSKSPDGGERVRVTNSEDFLAESNSIKQTRCFEMLDTSNLTEEIQTRNIMLDEEHEKTFVVKLFPMDDEKEVQEMSLHCK